MTIEFRICRICHKDDLYKSLVHYGVRSYAHPACLFKKHGEDGIRRLHAHQIRRMPVLALINAGLSFDRLTEILTEREAKESRTATSPTLAE